MLTDCIDSINVTPNDRVASTQLNTDSTQFNNDNKHIQQPLHNVILLDQLSLLVTQHFNCSFQPNEIPIVQRILQCYDINDITVDLFNQCIDATIHLQSINNQSKISFPSILQTVLLQYYTSHHSTKHRVLQKRRSSVPTDKAIINKTTNSSDSITTLLHQQQRTVASNKRLQYQVDVLQRHVTELNAANTMLQSQLQTRENELIDLNVQYQSALKSLQMSQSPLIAARNAENVAIQQIQRLSYELELAHDELTHLTKLHTTCDTVHQQLLNTNIDLITEKKALTTQINNLKQQLDSASDANKQPCNGNCNSNNSGIIELSKIQDMQQSLDDARVVESDLRAIIDVLHNKLNKLSQCDTTVTKAHNSNVDAAIHEMNTLLIKLREQINGWVVV